MKAVIISGFLDNISDNIIPFLDKETDVYVHTWKKPNSKHSRWVVKLNRYKKFCNRLKINIEDPIYDLKLFSYFYSTHKAVTSIENIDSYDYILKFKPNLNTEKINFNCNIKESFNTAKFLSRPLLDSILIDECIFGLKYYKTLDERMFIGKPFAFKKIFLNLNTDLDTEMKNIHRGLKQKYGKNYEGSIFWTEWINKKGIKVLQSIGSKLSNNIYE